MRGVTRRQVLGAGLAAGAGLAMGPTARAALAAATAPCPTAGSRLADIEHVIVMIQENRSFDHYFGTYRGVLGFGDPAGRDMLAQPGYPAGRNPDGRLLPFHLDTQHANGECVADPIHTWGAQHHSWDGGRMDGFVRANTAAIGPANGPITMGYYDRNDLPFYYALADAFTLCDSYFCSAIGPTDPNRLHAMSGTIDPDGKAGGPVVGSAGSTTEAPRLHWTTMPERLRANGISWKVYSSPDSTYEDGDNTLLFFQQYRSDPELAAGAFGSTFPGTFEADVAAGNLPTVSWLISPVALLEHPTAPPTYGEYAVSRVLLALTSNPAIWAKTVFVLTWDENGGFFDHVAPPVPPPGTPGEYLSVTTLPDEAEGIAGPIGLGFRVPTFIVSPFSRGGFVCSDTFDHTSLLRLIETRFGVEVPNVSAWRRSAVGDLTSALNLAAPDASVPDLPAPSLSDPRVASECVPGAIPGVGAPYPVPPNSSPPQEPGVARRPSGLACAVGGSGLSTGATGGTGAGRLPATGRPEGLGLAAGALLTGSLLRWLHRRAGDEAD